MDWRSFVKVSQIGCSPGHKLTTSTMLGALWSFTSRHQHRDVVSVEEHLIEPSHPLSLAGTLVLHHVLQNHVDKVVESEQGSHDLFVVLHDDVNPRSDSLVH